MVTHAASVAAIVLTLAGSAWAKPAIFADQSFDQAVAQSKEQKKLLVVKFTADWCPPCKQMDKTTWVDKSLVEWVGANGAAIAVDVDKEPKVAEANQIEAMPTMVLFKDGVEFDRVVGFRSAPQMLTWMKGAAAGEKAVTAVKNRLKEKAPGKDGLSMQARLAAARELLSAREHAAALEEYLWLWDNMLEHEPAMVGVRGSFMAADMERLAAAHAPAKARFRQLRDALEATLKNPDTRTWDALDDWLVLNEILGDEAATLAWFDRIKDDPTSAETLQRTEFRWTPILTKKARWADWGRTITNPVSRIDSAHHIVAVPGMPEEMRKVHVDMFRTNAANTVRALAAAGRPADAAKAAARARELDPAPEFAATLKTAERQK